MKFLRLLLLAVGSVVLPLAVSAQVLDDFSDSDRLTYPPTSTNTTWYINGSLMTPSVDGMLWDFNGSTSNRMALGYFPAVTVGTTAVTFSLDFTTGAFGSTPNNIRMALVDSSPAGYVTTDGFSSSDAAYAGDVGYGFFSATSNVGGGSTTDLVMRTYERSNLSSNLLGSSSDWNQLANSDGATGYLDANTTYNLSVEAQMVDTGLSLSVTMTGGNLTGMSYSIIDTTSPVTTFDTFAIRWGSGSNQFATVNLESFSVSSVPEPSTYAALLGLGMLGFAAWRRRRR